MKLEKKKYHVQYLYIMYNIFNRINGKKQRKNRQYKNPNINISSKKMFNEELYHFIKSLYSWELMTLIAKSTRSSTLSISSNTKSLKLPNSIGRGVLPWVHNTIK